MSESEPNERPRPPVANCPDAEDCIEDATEIGHICTFGPICGTCTVYRATGLNKGLLAGTCRVRTDRETFACTAPICDQYIPRTGAPNAKGEIATQGERLVALAGGKKGRTRQAAGRRSAPHERPVRVRIPDGPVGELEMTREELKELIRDAMDEERGGAEVPLAGKWEGGSIVLKPGDPNLQSKEIPIDALLHKVVMVRDRLRVLEQKINGNKKLSDAEKVEMQAYITKSYGSLTTLNVLFRDEDDRFTGERSNQDK